MELKLSFRRALALLAAAGAAVALVLAMTLASANASPALHRHAAHHARHHPTQRTTDPANPADTGNVQSGDQTSPDNPSSRNSGEAESTVESEHGRSGEPANGHQDIGGNVDHRCDANCVE